MRKLASIREIAEIRPIPDADNIELAQIDGWQLVVKKGEFRPKDWCVYHEIDSFLPIALPQYEFLTRQGVKTDAAGNRGVRLRTIKLRGTLSQGLALPVGAFFEPDEPIELGADVTERLGITKWEPPVPACLAGQMRGSFPGFLRKTDQERIQNVPHLLAGTGDWEVTIKLDGCFGANTYLPTWDGGSVRMRDIAIGGARPTLVGVNSDGRVVPCEIIQSFNNGRKDVWIDVRFTPPSGSRSTGKSGRLRTTPNHMIFTSHGEEVPAGSLKPGDKIVSFEACPDEQFKHYVRSSLLGDGCLSTKLGKSTRFQESHKAEHSDYCDYIESILGASRLHKGKAISGYGTPMTIFSTSACREFDRMRSEWYVDGKARVPEDLSWMDDFSVAKWYMDDGSLAHSEFQNDRACFATNSFPEHDVTRLRDKLVDMYGVSVSIQHSKGFTLRINHSDGSIHAFWNAIAKHVHPSMRYKLPAEYREATFERFAPCRWTMVPIEVQVTGVFPVENSKKNFPNGRIGFDLETTTHNYFCQGVLVHNSSMTAYHRDGDLGVCSRNIDLTETDGNTFWKVAREHGLPDKLATVGNIAVQGELIGEGIQGNPEKVSGHDFYVFDVWLIDEQRYATPTERYQICADLNLKHVPIEHVFGRPPATVDHALALADGPSLNPQTRREGLVFKRHCGTQSFKVISNAFLLRQKD